MFLLVPKQKVPFMLWITMYTHFTILYLLGKEILFE